MSKNLGLAHTISIFDDALICSILCDCSKSNLFAFNLTVNYAAIFSDLPHLRAFKFKLPQKTNKCCNYLCWNIGMFIAKNIVFLNKTWNRIYSIPGIMSTSANWRSSNARFIKIDKMQKVILTHPISKPPVRTSVQRQHRSVIRYLFIRSIS